jgi:hypothetical protein
MTQFYFEIKPIMSIEDFFATKQEKYESFPPHRIRESPCYQILKTKKLEKNELVCYYCVLHPNDFNVNLSAIEHHCRYL